MHCVLSIITQKEWREKTLVAVTTIEAINSFILLAIPNFGLWYVLQQRVVKLLIRFNSTFAFSSSTCLSCCWGRIVKPVGYVLTKENIIVKANYFVILREIEKLNLGKYCTRYTTWYPISYMILINNNYLFLPKAIVEANPCAFSSCQTQRERRALWREYIPQRKRIYRP